MRVVKLYSKNNPPERLQEIVDTLRDGGVIVYPTDTTYALGCHALKERAVERVCRIKGIDPLTHPLSVVCYDMSAISEYARISNAVFKVMKRNLPGPFTFILQGKNKLPKIFRSKKEQEIGIRMPDFPLVHELLGLLDAPLMTTSLPADEYDEEEYLTNPELIAEAFGSRVDIVVDAGLGRLAQSTIVDCKNDEPVVVRQGEGMLQ